MEHTPGKIYSFYILLTDQICFYFMIAFTYTKLLLLHEDMKNWTIYVL